MHNLPENSKLDIAALSRVFKSTTNSYKILFFLSILSLLKQSKFKERKLRINDVIVEMLTLSCIPIVKFKLSFGTQDQIKIYLEELFSITGDGSTLVESNLKKTIRNDLYKSQALKLGNYVPYRLLQPFYEEELRGQKDAVKNTITENLANQTYDTRLPLYRVVDDYAGTLIELHPNWMAYIEQNYPILLGWVEVNWISYLQRRNPNTPAILNKIHSYAKRGALTAQRKVWEEYLRDNQVDCLFSEASICTSNYDLDHFIPWNYVGHDQYWNLIPALPEVNVRKSDTLPSAQYLKSFVSKQRHFFEFCFANNKKTAVEDYTLGLNIVASDLYDSPSLFCTTLSQVVSSQLDMAKIQGFKPDWRYRE